jgi:iron complex outermembrane receptor protein
VSRASREPVRGDFIDASPGQTPKPEYLTDIEMGWKKRWQGMEASVNGYVMYYQDQLVLTGEVNDVGSPVRTNVPESYRAGIEATAHINFPIGFFWLPNVTLSQNKITRFDETIYDYTNGFDVVTIEHADVDIAFSPSLIAGSQLGWRSDIGFEVALMSKYVGRQYLDNTQNEGRSIDPYLVHDLRIRYQSGLSLLDRFECTLLINNITGALYASNGYTYSYIYESLVTENFYYPQAGINWLLGIKVRI